MSITYGDTFTLPSITFAETGEPVTFLVQDRRTIEGARAMYHPRARFDGVNADGSWLDRGLSLKVGTIFRTVSELPEFDVEWAHDRLRFGSWSAALTNRANQIVADDIDALDLDLPDYTLAEMREELIKAAKEVGISHGWLQRSSMDTPWNSYPQRQEAREFLAEAMDVDTRLRMHDALTAAFNERVAERLRVQP